MLKLAILISGRGSNMLNLITEIKKQALECKIVCVIANKQAKGLELAKACGVDTKLIERTIYNSTAEHELAILKELNNHKPDWIFLAGYMAILSAEFVNKYYGKIINIHPSLLPKFKGLNTHRRAIESGELLHGVTIHIVTNELDGGPIIAQSELTIMPEDTPETLEDRVLKEEHVLYPLVLSSLVKKQLQIKDSRVTWHRIPSRYDVHFAQKNTSTELVSNSILKLKNLH